MKEWAVTVKIGNRTTVWVFPSPSKEAAKKHAELQLKLYGNGKVVKVEEYNPRVGAHG